VKHLSILLLLAGSIVAPVYAGVIGEDDSISFEIPLDDECQSCQGEWEPLFPAGDEPEETPIEFAGISVGGEEPPPAEDVPEPVTWLLIGGGLCAMGLWKRRRNSSPL
jgi:hypothetical protein